MFGIIGVYLIYFSLLILFGQVTPTVGQIVYTMGSRNSKSKPYIIETEYQIYEYLISRIIVAILYLGFSIYIIKDNIDIVERNFGKLSFVKLLKLIFDEQNQVVKYIIDKIEGNR